MRYGVMVALVLGMMATLLGCQQAEPQAEPEAAAVESIPPRRGQLVERDGKVIWMDEPITFEDEE